MSFAATAQIEAPFGASHASPADGLDRGNTVGNSEMAGLESTSPRQLRLTGSHDRCACIQAISSNINIRLAPFIGDVILPILDTIRSLFGSLILVASPWQVLPRWTSEFSDSEYTGQYIGIGDRISGTIVRMPKLHRQYYFY